jgi:hypothetical protein
MQYDAVGQKMNEKVDLTASALIKGDEVRSLLQYSNDTIMICCAYEKTALIFSVASIQKIKSVSINIEQTTRVQL